MDEATKQKIENLAKLPECLPSPTNHVYHYTDIHNIPSIFKSGNIYFKLTKSENFDDKFEGKSLIEFYEKALNELVAEKTAKESDREKLEKIKPADRHFFHKNELKETISRKPKNTLTYIGCFSTVKDSEYMVKEYIKNKNHVGACIEFLPWCLEIKNNNLKKEFLLTPQQVLYEHDAVAYIKKLIKDILKNTDGANTGMFDRFGPGIIGDVLLQMRYMTKHEEYRNENEYRVVLEMPGDVKEIPDESKEQGIIKEGDEVFMKLPTIASWNITLINMDDISYNETIKKLKENGYKKFLNIERKTIPLYGTHSTKCDECVQ